MIGDSSTILPNANDDAHTSILNLEAELHKQAENCEKMSLSIKQGAFDLKQKDEEIVQQKHKASSLNRKTHSLHVNLFGCGILYTVSTKIKI